MDYTKRKFFINYGELKMSIFWNVTCFISKINLYEKSLARGRTDHFSNILADRKITQLLLLIYSLLFHFP